MTGRRDFPEGAVLVFGGSGGIGSVIARSFGEAGTNVAVTYRSNAARADEVVKEIEGLGVHAAAFPADVTDRAQIEKAIADTVARFGRLHSVVFVAGALPVQDYITQYSDEAWHEAIDVEVHGFYNVVRAATPALKAGGGGSFVHLGSAGDIAWANRDGLSVVPKAANEALVKGVAKEEGRFNIRANSVLIGVIEAGMFLKFKEQGVFDDAWIKATYARQGLKRLGKPEEVADAVVFLASNRASYVTGQQIAVAGGYGI
ncbi:SDR family NAD(P)-dependent oxidoreductase [Sphingomonas montanisoli]|uniref:SDR family oxidoreductase n=1 Tax=Sphingomonas montanisoli TaxID=2606412 RepID=A0A5D9CBQ9_9SPHN|nr:SDR family oxidoreductase [Sphingomonas montanisoli]TZG29388.1 SDR family oxidoreductase [Sphingomonas montanisoli]